MLRRRPGTRAARSGPPTGPAAAQLGNVAAGARSRPSSTRPELALLGATVTNPLPATGGADRESIEHAVRHAPAVFRSQRRAVTAGDYEALALTVQRASARCGADADRLERVTLLVAPAGGGQGQRRAGGRA